MLDCSHGSRGNLSGNVDTWKRDYAIDATLVPLGHAAGVMETAAVAESDKDIDVLFFGT